MRRQVRIASRGLIGPIGCIVLLTHTATFILAAEPQPDIKGPAKTPTVLGATHCCGVIPNPTLKGRLGHLVVEFPAGALPNGTKVAVLKDGKEVNAGFGNRTWDLLPGTYDVVISGKQVSNVTVQARHDTMVKVGVLRISIGPQTKVSVLDGGNEIAGGYGDRLIGLLPGSYNVTVAGQTQSVTITEGQVTDF
jgi:hypothetical protein